MIDLICSEISCGCCVFAKTGISHQSMNGDFVSSAVGECDCGHVVTDVIGPLRVLEALREIVLFT